MGRFRHFGEARAGRERLPLPRRAVLLAAAGAMASLVAACSKPNGSTTFLGVGDATAPAVAPVGATAVPARPPTVAIPTIPPIVVSSGGTVVPMPTAKKGAPPPDLLRMLAFVPDRPDVWSGVLTYANVAEAKRLYGFETIRAFEDFKTQNVATIDYTNATGGCALSDFTGQLYATGQYRDAFGFDAFQVDREISPNGPPNNYSYMEGAFDAEMIAARLQAAGYKPAMRDGAPYDTVRGDSEINLNDPRADLALGRMNRIAASRERIIAAPKTATIEAALDAEARKGATLDANPTLRALAAALVNITSLATAPPDAFALASAGLRPDEAAQLARDYRPLHPAELVAMGYTDAGNFRRTMHVALVYADAKDAAADEPELLRRYQNFRSLRTRQLLLPTYATGVTSRTVTVGNKGVAVIDIALQPQPALSRFWLSAWYGRDTPLLQLPTAATPSGSARAGSATSGTRTP